LDLAISEDGHLIHSYDYDGDDESEESESDSECSESEEALEVNEIPRSEYERALWHGRLAHANHIALKSLGYQHDIPDLKSTNRRVCRTCAEGKSCRITRRKEQERSKSPGEKFHADTTRTDA